VVVVMMMTCSAATIKLWLRSDIRRYASRIFDDRVETFAVLIFARTAFWYFRKSLVGGADRCQTTKRQYCSSERNCQNTHVNFSSVRTRCCYRDMTLKWRNVDSIAIFKSGARISSVGRCLAARTAVLERQRIGQRHSQLKILPTTSPNVRRTPAQMKAEMKFEAWKRP
jgi:hypothetical protein